MKRVSVCLMVLLLLCMAGIWAYDKTKCDDKPSQTGPCKASFQMWRFIKEQKICESFTYGGCQGTNNLFDQEEDCKTACLV
ncbi:uncharacterized protein Dana_GF27285 [Drosophila ananassae]|uniref:BPTI/Kunitz inhibitor domain-containing protein n=1 Tax=Drosophila ananassae TaxID=7217 RepID=A0A0P9A778_DROAN|nr:isoinhibitor K isoform X2 [Drosophila ananassae]KPU74242.1 uncharacterized protein Dana_GF27285 [Drosophila ananassae]